MGWDSLQVSLAAHGNELAFAASGAEVLATAEDLAPDLILLDVTMPGMDGFEVCRRLRADPHLAEVPILLITALDGRRSRLQGIEAGADDFISKPFDRTELRVRVQTITRLNRYRCLLVERTQREAGRGSRASQGPACLQRLARAAHPSFNHYPAQRQPGYVVRAISPGQTPPNDPRHPAARADLGRHDY